MVRFLTFLPLLALTLTAALPAAGEDPAVARPRFQIGGETVTRGTVFFVRADTPAGAGAVGTAHTFDLTKMLGARRGLIVLEKAGTTVASTRGWLVPPGTPFNAPGSSLRDDYVVYALDAAPLGVRVLELARSDELDPGQRVRLLGVPSEIPQDEDDIFGRVVGVSEHRIDVDLDAPYELRGWGGAPVINERDGRVVGIVQAHFPQGTTSRVVAAPVAKLRAALSNPLDAGAGLPFRAFRDELAKRRKAETASPPAPAPRAARAPTSEPPERRTARTRTVTPSRPGPLLHQNLPDPTTVHLNVDYPASGSVVGDAACGVFVAGRALAIHGELRHFDVMIVVDTSRSTVEPTGADINGNGIVGKPYLGRIGSIFDVGSTDSGDSILAAEVAAARQLLRGLDPRSTRVGVVTFAGEPPDAGGGLFSRAPRHPAITLQPLTTDYARVERVLDDILARSPEGSTHMAAGVDQATIELIGLRGAQSEASPKSEKVVFFFTDGQPTLPYGPAFEADNVRAVLRAANRASRAKVRIHSFAIGPDALDGPVATVEMAHRTEGYFTPVRHPGDLVDAVEEVSFANLDGISLKNATTGELAEPFRTTADGSWGGLVPLQDGKNRIEVVAKASDGAMAARSVDVHYQKGAKAPPVPEEFAVQRNRLLEDCLRSIKQVRMSAERERAEQVRKDLMVEIERERAKARERAADQRKQLQLDVDTEEGTD